MVIQDEIGTDSPTLGLFVGPAASGKTEFLIQIADQIAQHRYVLYLAISDPPARIAALRPSPQCHIVSQWPRNEEAFEQLADWVDTFFDVGLIVIDDLVRLLAPSKRLQPEDSITAFRRLRSIGAQGRTTIMVVHHPDHQIGKFADHTWPWHHPRRSQWATTTHITRHGSQKKTYLRLGTRWVPSPPAD